MVFQCFEACFGILYHFLVRNHRKNTKKNTELIKNHELDVKTCSSARERARGKASARERLQARASVREHALTRACTHECARVYMSERVRASARDDGGTRSGTTR